MKNNKDNRIKDTVKEEDTWILKITDQIILLSERLFKP
jgi:hypothetical protein